MYNLDEQLANKTLKQATRMIHSRMLKALEADQIVSKYDCYPYNDQERYIKLVEKNRNIVQDCIDWLYAASYCFNPDLWDRIVSEEIICSKGLKHQLIDCYSFDNLHC